MKILKYIMKKISGKFKINNTALDRLLHHGMAHGQNMTDPIAMVANISG